MKTYFPIFGNARLFGLFFGQEVNLFLGLTQTISLAGC